jgi:acetyltransferase-like isoleucine patch superfamily enzyme
VQRLLKLLGSILDPRALAHAALIVGRYNTTHVQPLRHARKRQGRISPTASFANGQNSVLGNRVHVGANTSLWAGPGRIVLGDDVLLGPHIMMTAANYRFNDGTHMTDQAMDEGDIVLGRDIWVGRTHSDGASRTIGDGTIIGAASFPQEVVVGLLPPCAVAMGSAEQPITSTDTRGSVAQIS